MATKKDTNKYRVSIYLGKELYEELEPMAKFIGVPFSTFIRIMIQTGTQFAKVIDAKGGIDNGGN